VSDFESAIEAVMKENPPPPHPEPAPHWNTMSVKRAGEVVANAMNHYMNGQSLESVGLPTNSDKYIVRSVEDIATALNTMSRAVATILTCCEDTDNIPEFRDNLVKQLAVFLAKIPTPGDLLKIQREFFQLKFVGSAEDSKGDE
jgi:hypothetical protein